LRQVGECIFVSTDKGIMEARECVERKIGGQVLCRVW
jgi:ribosomal protein S8